MDSHVLYSFHQYAVKNYNPNYNFFFNLQSQSQLQKQPVVYCWISSQTAAQAGCKQRERQSIPQPSANRLLPSLLELFVNCSMSRLQAKHSPASILTESGHAGLGRAGDVEAVPPLPGHSKLLRHWHLEVGHIDGSVADQVHQVGNVVVVHDAIRLWGGWGRRGKWGKGVGVGHGLECNVAESTTTLTIPPLPLNMKRWIVTASLAYHSNLVNLINKNRKK